MRLVIYTQAAGLRVYTESHLSRQEKRRVRYAYQASVGDRLQRVGAVGGLPTDENGFVPLSIAEFSL